MYTEYRNSIIIVIDNQHYCSLLITIVQRYSQLFSLLLLLFSSTIISTPLYDGYDVNAAVILISFHHIYHSFLSRAHSVNLWFGVGAFLCVPFFRFRGFSLNWTFIRPTVDSQSPKWTDREQFNFYSLFTID